MTEDERDETVEHDTPDLPLPDNDPVPPPDPDPDEETHA